MMPLAPMLGRWLRSLPECQTTLLAGSRGRSRRRRRLAPPAILESLEDRTVLSSVTLHVTSLEDSGAGTLRDAIETANGDTSQDYTIDFSVTGTIDLETALPSLAGTIALNGPGAEALTVERDPSAGADFGIISVSPAAVVTLSSLTIANGSAATGGGGIDNGGTLNASGIVVANNQSTGGLGGGGILNESTGALTLDDSTVRHNIATAAPGSDVFGGGLLNLGHAAIDGATFLGNRAAGGSAVDFFGGSAGGAIDNYGGASLQVTSSKFLANQAIGAAEDANGYYFGMGGAIENNAGALDDSPSSATLIGCVFVRNVATAGAGGVANGGAIDNQGGGTTMTLTGCTIAGNRGVGGSNGLNGQSFGGGILNASGSVMNIDDCRVIANTSQGGSGTTPSLVLPSSGFGEGGGITNGFATLTVTGCTIAGNLAAGGTTTVGPGGNAFGGGIDNLGGNLTLIGSGVFGNAAIAASGGSFPSPAGVRLGVAGGGGLNDWADGSATVTGCTFAGNSASGGGGGAGVAGGDAFGGGISVGTDAYFGFVDASSLSLGDSVVAFNLAIGGAGGKGADGGNAFGGGIVVWGTVPTTPDNPDPGGSTATIDAITVSLNAALGGRRGHRANAGEGHGGGLYIAPGGSVAADHATRIRWNVASTNDDNLSDDGGGFTTT
jgi:hypothetical protein